MKTVRHWRRGYQHDHSARTVRGALSKCMRCAGHDISDGALKTMASLIKDKGWFEYIGPDGAEIYRLQEG